MNSEIGDKKFRVVILDDHQPTIDGYFFRLSRMPQIEVVGVAYFGVELEPLLETHPADVLFLDVQVPTAPDKSSPYPILHFIPKLQQRYPDLAILVISMMTESALIQAIMDAGASGYILKDDRSSIEQLGAIVLSIANGGMYLSDQARKLINSRRLKKVETLLTPRQLEALSLSAAHPEWSSSDLAVALNVTGSTARNLLHKAYLRLEVTNLAAAVAKARDLGLITPLPLTTPRELWERSPDSRE